MRVVCMITPKQFVFKMASRKWVMTEATVAHGQMAKKNWLVTKFQLSNRVSGTIPSDRAKCLKLDSKSNGSDKREKKWNLEFVHKHFVQQMLSRKEWCLSDTTNKYWYKNSIRKKIKQNDL